MTAQKPAANQIADRIAAAEALDAPGKKLGKAIRQLTKPKKLKDALSGTWLGHPVHPLLIAVPIGTWTSAVLLDLLGGEDTEGAADGLVAAGLAAALPTVATGYSDWADTEPGNDPVRRVGLAHAASNAAGITLFAASLAARASGARGRGKLLALAGMGAVGAGGWLGGHLTYAEGVGVSLTTFETYPEEWTPVLADAALGEGELRRGEVDGVAILVARVNGKVHALSNTCTHRGGQLDEGELQDGCVVCPLHSSVFRLEDGSVEQGPATFPQPVLEARVNEGSIEVRASADS